MINLDKNYTHNELGKLIKEQPLEHRIDNAKKGYFLKELINDDLEWNALYHALQKEADEVIDKHCQDLVARFKDKLQELTKQNPDIFDEISFEGFYPLGLDIHCFQNHAHGPSTDLDNIENGKRIHIHDTATLTINGTIETDYYEEHRQLLINAFRQLFIDTADQPYSQYALFRLNLITM